LRRGELKDGEDRLNEPECINVKISSWTKKQLLTAPNKGNEQTALTHSLFFLSPLRLAAIEKYAHSLFYGFSRQPLKHCLASLAF